MKKLIVVLVSICVIGVADAQTPITHVHPTPSDLASALQSVSVVLNRIDSPLSVLADKFDSEQISASMHANRIQIRELANRWASIITISDGKELPSASDLFTIYIEMDSIQSYSSDLTSADRFTVDTATLARNATIVIRGQTELVPVLETLKLAVADRIDVEEATCLKPSSIVKH
jgi:hypothetical protein